MDPSYSNRPDKISGRMHLLDGRDYTQSIDTLSQVLIDVYSNFISMANVIEHAAFGNQIFWIFPIVPNTTHTSPNLTTRIWELKYLMGFIRSALKWCVSDGGVINRTLVDLLTSIEADFIEFSHHCISLSSDEGVLVENHGDESFDLNFSEQKILDAYLFIWRNCVPSTSMFTEGSVMERLDQTIEDDRKHKKQSVVMKQFIHFVKESTGQASLENILPWVDYLLDMMMCYFFHSNMKEPYSDIASRLDAAIDCIVLHILVWHPESRPPFTGELMVAYVECIRENLVRLLSNEYVCLSEQLKQQIIIVCDLLRNVLRNSLPKCEFDQEKLFPYTALKQLGCIISSFFAFEFDCDKMSFQITDWLLRIFQAFYLQLESEGSLTSETSIQYFFQHYQFLLSTGEGVDMKSPSENQTEFDRDLACVTSVKGEILLNLIIEIVAVLTSMGSIICSYLNNKVKRRPGADPGFRRLEMNSALRELLLNGRTEIVGVLTGLGSITCSYLNNKGNRRIEMNSGLHELLLKFDRVKELTRLILNKIFIFSRVQVPQTDPLGFLSLLLENLGELRVRNFDLVRDWKDQFQTIHDDLVVFRSFLQKSSEKSINCDSSQHLSIRIRKATYDAEYIINAFAAGAFHEWTRSVLISDLIEQFNLIKEEVKTAEIVIEGSSDVLPHEPIPTTNSEKIIIHASAQVSVSSNNVILGFEVVMKLLMERLASDKKQLDVISVVGMPGIGKTTLAKKVYEDPYTVGHFPLLAWCVVSHDYDKKELLLRILGTDGIPDESYEELGQRLHKKLFGSRYLIVLDDVWDIDAFYCLKRFFPNVDDGSRIVLTSRALLTGHDSNPVKLSLLSDDECWNILKEKVYPKEEFPIELREIGKRIAKKCGGLPLAVVVVAGLLAKSDKVEDVWKEIAERLSIYSANDDDHSQGERMKALDLSYELLPDHLKPLFLYVGAFPEDSSISTKELKWLWISEGFIRKSEKRSQEDQAETYLMELIDRSLLMVGEIKSDGLVKTCRIHDLMRDMALSKAKAEFFLHCIGNMNQLLEHLIFARRVCAYNFEGAATVVSADEALPRHGLSTYDDDLPTHLMPSCLNSVLFFCGWKDQSASIFFKKHKMLRVFDMRDYYDGLELPDDVSLPVHLRYISCRIRSIRIPSSIFSLWDLETLNIYTGLSHDIITVPGEVWKMAKLRNLHINNGYGFTINHCCGECCEECCEEGCEECSEKCCSNRLENLQTLSWVIFNVGEESEESEDTELLIGRIPNVVKLKCVFSDKSGDKSGMWPRLESLHQLQSLNVEWMGTRNHPSQFITFPSTLKKLTLERFKLKWKDISILQEVLPNLEILKLKYDSVIDELWDMEDGVFPKLKFLELGHLNIKRWIASAENFPCLEKLVLNECCDLEEIPCSFGEIYSLEKIQLKECSHSASESARRIEKEQIEEFGNDLLKVRVLDPLLPPRPPKVVSDKIELSWFNQSISESAKSIQKEQIEEEFGNNLPKLHVSLPFSPYPPKDDDGELSEE